MTKFEKPIARDLTSLIRRYDAYQELKEGWMEGIELLDQRDPQYLSKTDAALKVALTCAVGLVQDELDKLSGDSYKRLELKREINAIPADPRGIIGGRGTPRDK